MKTDIEPRGFLTQPTRPHPCPVCSKPLRAHTTTCFSCGYSPEPPTGSAVWIDPAVYAYKPTDAAQASTLLRAIPERRKFATPPKKQPNPLTPIPPRASAQGVEGMKALSTEQQGQHRQKLQHSVQQHHLGKAHSISLKNTGKLDAQATQPPIWQYETPGYAAESSLSSLTLLIAEMPTDPGLLRQEDVQQQAPTTKRLPRIDEIDTVPPHLANAAATQTKKAATRVLAIDEIDTIPNLREVLPIRQPASTASAHLAVVPVAQPAQVVEGHASSWTAGDAAGSHHAQLIADRRKKRSHSFSLNPADRVRWWLLRPGRLEFMLWLGSTILLISMTCLLLLMTAFNFNWIAPNAHENTASTSGFDVTPVSTHPLPTITTTPGLLLSLLDTHTLLPGESFHVRGEGFSTRGTIVFLLDGTQSMPDQTGQPSWTKSNVHGEFTAALYIGLNWTQGPHLVIARDVATNRLAALVVAIAPSPIGKASTPTSVPPPPGSKATPTQQGNPGGGVPSPGITPVNNTPVPTTPTPGITPTHGITPTPVPPSPTPTHTVTPTVTPSVSPSPSPTAKAVGQTPTAGVTPSPTSSAAGQTPTAGVTPSPTGTPAGLTPTATSSSTLSGQAVLGNALGATPSTTGSFSLLNPLVWLMIGCYVLSMVLLGIAGVLHRRRR